MQVLKSKSKVKKTKIVMTVEKTPTGFSAFSEDLPIFTTGASIPELLKNVQEAINYYFEDQQINIEPDQIKFEIDFRQFFKYYKVLNAKYLGEKIGMNPSLISQYVSGAKKPSSKQTEKILKGINQIGVELAGIHLLKTE